MLLPYPNQSRTDTTGQIPYQVTINTDGFRNVPHTTIEGASYTLSVLCLGDSFTFGFAVDDSQTYPYYLELELEALLPDYDVTVFDGASIWMTIDSQLAIYEYLMAQGGSYDVVTLGYFGGNDLAELDLVPEIVDVMNSDNTPPWLLANSALLRLVQRDRFEAAVPNLQEAIQRQRTQGGSMQSRMETYTRLFGELVTHVRQNNQQFHVLRIDGYLAEFDSRREEGQFIIDLAQSQGYIPILLDYSDGDYLLPLDAHYSPQGNQHVARRFAQRIVESLE